MSVPALRHTRYTDHVLYRLVGAELRKQRLELGVTQKKMARRLGLSAPGLYKHETGRARVTLLLFVRVCRSLDLRPGEVLDRIVGWIDESGLPESEKLGTSFASEKEKE